MRLPKSFSMAVAKSLAKISFLYTDDTDRAAVQRSVFSKKFRLIREIRVPTGFIPDFAQAMSLSGRDIDLPFVSSYNNCMKIKLTGFFRPDHDPPQKVFLVL